MKEKRTINILRILEIFWLVIGIAALLVSIYSTLTHKSSQAVYFLVFSFIAGLMYTVRKKQRKINARISEKE